MTFLEYIESNGNQYITTGYIPNNNTEVVIDFSISQQKDYPAPFGCSAASNVDTFLIFGRWGGRNEVRYAIGTTGGQETYLGPGIYDTRITASLSSSHVQYGSLSADFTLSVTAQQSMYLFTINEGGNPVLNYCGSTMKLYSCQIYENNVLIHDYKPAQDNNTLGLYDTVTGIMHTNAGTGSFTAGPALNTYTVKFNANGGTGTMSDQTIEIDTPTPLSTNQFTKERSVFVGWSESASGPVQYTDGQAVTNLAEVGETVTLYAIWEVAPLSINLQSNASEKNKVDKDITNILTLAGTLRQETSILDPVILIEGSEETILTANYLTIPDFGRSYFITGFRSIRKDLIEISCHVDVLYSYKDTLRQQKAIIKRNTSNWNLYLNDGSLTTYQDPYVLTEPFPDGFTGQTFVLAVAGS